MTTKKFLTADEVFEFYGVDEAVLQDLVKDGSLKALPDRGTWKFRRDDIDALIRAQMLHPTKEMPMVGEEAVSDMITFADEGPSSSAVDFLELDEEALAEQPTMITTGTPGGFFPKLAEETTGDDSSSEVNVVLEPMESDSSDSDIRLAPAVSGDTSDSDVKTLSSLAATPSALTGDASDSDVQTLSNLAAPQSKISGDGSDSDVKTISSYEIAAAKSSDDSDSDVKTISSFDMPAMEANVLTDDSVSVFDMTADSGISLESPSDTGHTQEIELADDDDAGRPIRSAEPTMEMKTTDSSSFDIASESALKLGGSAVKPGDSSMLIDGPGSSVIDFDDDDSGISLDTADSGISLDTGDSGISLDTADSGISLDAGDSGISLSAGDSGISLEKDSGLSLDPKTGRVQNLNKTEAMFDVQDDDDDFQLAGAGAGMTQPSLSTDDDMEATAAFHLGDEDSGEMPTMAGLSDDELPVTPQKKDPLGFSGAIAAGATIEGLEVVDDLDTMFPEEDGPDALAAIDDEDVEELEASDESFAEFDEAPADDFESEEYESPAAVAKAPKERGWGALATMSVMAATLLLGVNGWLLWEGLSTMWTGAQPSGPASAIISSLAGLF